MGFFSSVRHAVSDAYHDAAGAVTGYLGSSTSAYLTPVASYFTPDGREQLWGSYGQVLSNAVDLYTGGATGGIVQNLGDQYLAAPPSAPASSGGGSGGGAAYFPAAAPTSSGTPVWLWPAVGIAAAIAVITFVATRWRR